MQKRWSKPNEQGEMLQFMTEILPYKFDRLEQLRRIFSLDQPQALARKRDQVFNFVNASALHRRF